MATLHKFFQNTFYINAILQVVERKEIKIAILRMEGTNCEEETFYAFRELGVNPEYVHIKEFERKKKDLFDYHGLFIPGGFSAGDYVRAGAIFAARIKAAMMEDISAYIDDGYPIMGVCNGFQVLIELGVIPGLNGISNEPEAALAANDSNKFECLPTLIRHEGNSRLTEEIPRGKISMVPCAHAEGKIIFKNEEYAMEAEKQVVFRYVSPDGKLAGYPWNPNGSYGNIAGLGNPDGNVLGMMPHPERAFHPWQGLNGRGDGKDILEGMIKYIEKR